jgi:AcrR family transcriptional regulator
MQRERVNLGAVTSQFHRARSPEAKHQREEAILDAAAQLAAERGVRGITLTDIADAVGMHKSAMLRYFETREEIYLRLTARGWTEWVAALQEQLDDVGLQTVGARRERVPAAALALARSLVSRPLFCDLLAHAPLNLERNVSLDAVRAFKLIALAQAAAASHALAACLGMEEAQARSTITAATTMAGALHQIAAPHTPALRDLYAGDPDLTQALVDVEPNLADILATLIAGYLTPS